MTLEEYIENHRKRVANMTLAQARDVIAKSLSHSDMEIEFDKAVQMLLDCADEKINNGWIFVTERLPKYSGRYLVNYSSGYVSMARYYESVSKWGSTTTERIVAWMPLPEPYGLESEEKE